MVASSLPASKDLGDLVGVAGAVKVELAGQELGQGGVSVGDDGEDVAIEVGNLVPLLVDAPEVGVALEDDALALDVLIEHEGATGNDLGGIGAHAPHFGDLTLFVGLFEDVLGNDVPALDQRRGEGLGEVGLDGIVVDLAPDDGRAIDFEVFDGVGTHVGVGVYLSAEDDIVGGDGLTVGPLRALAQVEDDGQAVILDLPALGKVAFGLEGVGVVTGERGKEEVDDGRRRGFLGDEGVEGLRVGRGPVAEVAADNRRFVGIRGFKHFGLGHGNGSERQYR